MVKYRLQPDIGFANDIFCHHIITIEVWRSWGRFRALPVADTARNKEWHNKEYCDGKCRAKTTYVVAGAQRSYSITLKYL